ncbi:MAG: radical SAM protein [Promethearchaeota archaeon]
MVWRLLRPDAKRVWDDSAVITRLSRYWDIMNEKRIAKYLIAKKIDANVELDGDLPKLLNAHERIKESFGNIIRRVDDGELEYESMDPPKVSYLDLKIELAQRMLEECIFCERRCRVNRRKGEKGTWCKLDGRARISSAFLHHGEEAPLVPSGTIFFTSCNFCCVFCQNYDISQVYPENGVEVPPEKLASIARNLKREGARNINYVGGDPTPNLHVIVESLKYSDINVTQLWNSNLYCSEETMNILLDIMDFWLPDMKYYSDECAKEFSIVPNYWTVISRNHKLAYDHGGGPDHGEMIIRHLVLPNHVDCCTIPILEWIAENCPKVLVNIMAQYRPTHLVGRNKKYSSINRRPTSKEMEKAYNTADALGIIWRPVS